MNFRFVLVIVLMVTLTSFAACGEESPSSVADGEMQSAGAANGLSEPMRGVEKQLNDVAHAMALTLGSAPERALLYRTASASPHKEKKIQLRRDLLVDAPFKSRFEAHLAPREGGALALLDSLPALEVYLPVDEHRASWVGGEDVVVATTMHDSSEIFAYDLTGGRVVVTEGNLPGQSIIAVVFAEGFVGQPESQSYMLVNEDVMPALSSEIPRVAMYWSRIYSADNYEGLLQGDPEFEVHTYRAPSGSTDLRWYTCAGEYVDYSPQVYDQDYEEWSGGVRLTTAYGDEGVQFVHEVWEKDNGTSPGCRYWNDASSAPITDEDTRDKFWNTVKGVTVITAMCIAGGGTVACAKLYPFFIGASWAVGAYNPDDFVGRIERTRQECWRESTGAELAYIWRGSHQAGRAKIDWTYLERHPVCPDAIIYGDNYIGSPGTYNWSLSNQSGGDGNYTYKWYRQTIESGQLIQLGTGVSQSLTIASGDTEDFIMVAYITSATITTRNEYYVLNGMGGF